MLYSPTVVGNAWTTKTTSANGNGNIHCQQRFKEGVTMLESAIAQWIEPKLFHLVLTASTDVTYASFISRLSRVLRNKGITYAYKGCTEQDSLKGQHQHYMLAVDTDEQTAIEAINKVAQSVQASQPAFRLKVCQPHRYDTPYIALSHWTLQDAADWLSYIYKARSKPTPHVYLSSRGNVSSIGNTQPARPNGLSRSDFESEQQSF